MIYIPNNNAIKFAINIFSILCFKCALTGAKNWFLSNT